MKNNTKFSTKLTPKIMNISVQENFTYGIISEFSNKSLFQTPKHQKKILKKIYHNLTKNPKYLNKFK